MKVMKDCKYLKAAIIGVLAAFVVTSICLIVTFKHAKAEDNILIKETFGLTQLQNVKTKMDDLKSTAKPKQPTPVAGIGIGYDFGNSYRVEGMFDYYFLFHQREKLSSPEYQSTLNTETKVYDVVLSLYKDFNLNERADFTVGAGAGISSMQDESHGQYKHACETMVHELPYERGKQVQRLTYRLSGGLTYKIRDGMTGEILYSYINFGKNKPRYIEGHPNITPKTLQAHSILLGLRTYL